MPMLRPLLILLFWCGLPIPAIGQIHDDFSDGEFTSDPPWTGDLDRWTVDARDGDLMLRSHGAAKSDTILLALETNAAFGTWSFEFAHEGVNLSTFNGARVFLAGIIGEGRSELTGYYLQIGTNNSDAISLWRSDGNLENRKELARTEDDLVAGDSSDLWIVVERDSASVWRVSLNGGPVLEAQDDRYLDATHFIIWVKHTSGGSDAFFFDDIEIVPQSGPNDPGPHPDPDPDPDPNPDPEPDPAYATPRPGEIIINEIHYNPTPGGSEFVELMNRSDSTFDLRSLRIRDSQSDPIAITDSSVLLVPASFAVLVSDPATFSAQFREVAFIRPHGWASLNNGGDQVILEADGVIIDSIEYAGDVTPRGFSLERVDPNIPSFPANWAPSTDPFGATPGLPNTAYAPDDVPPVLTFIEQVGDYSIDLYFSEPLPKGGLKSDDVKVGGATPAELVASAPNLYRATFSAPLSADRVAIRTARDFAGNASGPVNAAIAFLPHARDLIINEIMYEPLADPYDGREEQAEYIELLNQSDRMLTLRGLMRTRSPDDSGEADSVAIGGYLSSLAPGELIVVAAELTPFLAAGSKSVLAPDLSLRNEGDVVSIVSPTGTLIDAVSYDPAWHHPDVTDTRGVSLERIDPLGKSQDARNWMSSAAPSGGTPGAVNSVFIGARPPNAKPGITLTPNPFTPDRDGEGDAVAVGYRIERDLAIVRIRIFDVTGHLVRELVPAVLAAREGAVYWDGRDEAGRRLRMGIYIVLLEAFDGGHRAVESYKAPLVLARRH